MVDVKANRAPPPLTNESLSLVPELLSVVVLLRHGSRVPDQYKHCYRNLSQTFYCNEPVNEVLLDVGGSSRTYFKRFDVGLDTNIIHGTCEAGQLVNEGRRQLKAVGEAFANSYDNIDQEQNVHRGARLLEKEEDTIYLRSSDMQRTRQSAISFAEGFFRLRPLNSSRQNLDIHTVDFTKDYIYPNDNVCPILKEAHNEFEASKEVKQLRNQFAPIIERVSLLSALPELRMYFPRNFFDCFVVPLCLNLDLPNDLLEPETALKVWEAMEKIEMFLFSYKNSMYSKIAARRFLIEVRDQIFSGLREFGGAGTVPATIPATIPNRAPHRAPASRLAVYVGHDTTILPFLHILFANSTESWPSYASSLSFELFRVSPPEAPKGFSPSLAFRVIFNGKIRTSDILACASETLRLSSELCGIQHLLKLLNYLDLADPCWEKLEHVNKNYEKFFGNTPEEYLTKTPKKTHNHIKGLALTTLIISLILFLAILF